MITNSGLQRSQSPSMFNFQMPADVQKVIPTGIDHLDDLLPLGGVPCGRITKMLGCRGSGRTTFLLSVVARATRQGERVAIIDMDKDLDAASFGSWGIATELVWVIEPSTLKNALWAADVLLRSGHFGMVVLDGITSQIRTASLVRLQRQAKESDAALLIGTNRSSFSAPGSLELRFRPLRVVWGEGMGSSAGPQQMEFSIHVDKGRGETAARFKCRQRRLLDRHRHIADRRPAHWTEQALALGDV